MKAYLEIKETEQLENAATCLRDRLLIRILSRLGCRISEALALRVDDIDFIQGSVTVEHLKSRIKVSCPRCQLSPLSVLKVLSHSGQGIRAMASSQVIITCSLVMVSTIHRYSQYVSHTY